jgi:MYXO-CTERM domain-containing protein
MRSMGLFFVTAAMLMACVPASADLILDDNGTHNLDYVVAESVKVMNSTKVNLLTDGSILGYLVPQDDSMVTVSGGSIGDGLRAQGNSTVNVFGGSIGTDLRAYANSIMNVSGGTIGYAVSAWDYSTLTILGIFNYAYGDYFDLGSLDGANLTGTLADGTAISNQVNIHNSGTVTLAAPVPEPASLLLALLGLALLPRRRRR